MAAAPPLVIRKINLLPRRLQQRAAYLGLVPYVAFGIGLGLALAGAARVGLSQHHALLEYQAGQAAGRNAVRAEQLSREAAQYALSPGVATRLAALNALVANELQWGNVFEVVNLTVAKDITATQVVVTRDPLKPEVIRFTVGGKAPSNVSFAEFRGLLLGNAQLQNAKVDAYSYDPQTGTVTFSFSFSYPSAKLTFAATPTP